MLQGISEKVSFKEQIDMNRLPRHIAIVMDGNGRWAKKQGKQRVFGHAEGVESVRSIIETARTIGISYLTLYTFSTENFSRPQEEVKALMQLMVKAIDQETDKLIANDIRCVVAGDLDRLDADIKARVEDFVRRTAGGRSLTVCLALSYSSRWEIARAAALLARDAMDGKIRPEDIDETMFASRLATAGIPDPDLLIRTGGEQRISNYLLWQAAYSELYFTATPWPEFREEALYEAIADYQKRERRFGKTSEQIKDNAAE